MRIEPDPNYRLIADFFLYLIFGTFFLFIITIVPLTGAFNLKLYLKLNYTLYVAFVTLMISASSLIWCFLVFWLSSYKISPKHLLAGLSIIILVHFILVKGNPYRIFPNLSKFGFDMIIDRQVTIIGYFYCYWRSLLAAIVHIVSFKLFLYNRISTLSEGD